MSTALSHLFGAPPALLSGSIQSSNFADLLQVLFEPKLQWYDLVEDDEWLYQVVIENEQTR